MAAKTTDEMLREALEQIGVLTNAVATIEAELERRDVEQMEVEGAIEFLLAQGRVWLRCIGLINHHVLGDNDTKYCGQEVFHSLYSVKRDDIVPGFREGAACAYQRPKRRWAQFGSKTQLLKIAAEKGVKLKSADRSGGREWTIRALWEHRALPGSVALFHVAGDGDQVPATA